MSTVPKFDDDDFIPLNQVEDEEDDFIPLGQPKTAQRKIRPSNPIRQGVAGLSDIATGIPMLAGAVGSAVGTTFDRDDDPETHWGQELMKNLMANSVFKFGDRGRRAVNEALGIEEPISIEDQGARLLTSLFIPGVGPLGAVAGGTGKAAMAARMLTPLVRIQKGKPVQNVARIGAQFGIGGGIDQGIRGYMESADPGGIGATLTPPIWSKAAREGVDADKYGEALSQMKSIHAQADADGDGEVDDFVPLSGEDVSAEVDDFVPVQTAESVNDELNRYRPEQADTDRKMGASEDESIAKAAVVTAGVAAMAIFGARYARSLRPMAGKLTEGMDVKGKPLDSIQQAGRTIKDEGVAGAKKVTKQAIQSFNEKWIDGTSHLRRVLREVGMDESDVAQLDGMAVVDTYGSIVETLRTGKFAGSKIQTGKVAEIAEKIRALPQEQQDMWTDGVHALQEWGRRAAATKRFGEVDILDEFGQVVGSRRRAPGLWRSTSTGGKELITDPELKEAIKALRSNDALYKMAKDLAKINDDVLKVAVDRNVLTPAIAKQWKAMHTFKDPFDTKKNMTFYMPSQALTGTDGTWGKLVKMMGFHTTKAKELDGPASWKGLDLEIEGSTSRPLDPLSSTADYMFQILDHVNRSNTQMNILRRLTGIDVDNTGAVTIKANADAMQSGVRFVGRLDPEEGANKVTGNMRWRVSGEGKSKGNLSPDEMSIRKELGIGSDNNPLAFLNTNERIIVQHKGQFYMFQVDNPHLKTALSLDPRLTGPIEQFFNQWKNNFTAFTTGRFSVFGPTSFLYNQQLATLSAFSQHGYREGMRTWVDSFRGAYEMFSYNVARDVTRILKRNLDENTGMFANMAPEAARKLTNMLERKIENSIVGIVQRESGRLASGLGASQVSGNITDILETAVPHLYKTYGANALPLIARTWTNLNNSLHEGAALGRVMRVVSNKGGLKAIKDEDVGRLMRTGVREAKDLVGDVMRRGTSPVARAFHASVPFSGAMFQAGAVVGNAIHKNPKMFTTALLTTVALPVAMEVTWNNAIDPDATFTTTTVDGEEKTWTYRDYYWNGFTAQQRNDNMILFVPGKPPWEASLIPISPEFTLIRSIMIEGMDTLFNLAGGDARATGNNGDHFLAALTRVLDIPVPPPAGAAIALATGMDFRAGFHTTIDDKGKDSMTFLHATPSGKSRIGGDKGVKESGDEFGTRTVQRLYDQFGAGAAASIAVAEAYYGGRDDEIQPFTDRIGRAFSEAGQMARKQARWTSPLFGKALSPNPNDHIGKELLVKRKTLEHARDMWERTSTGGMASAEGKLAGGNTMTGVDDPIYQAVILDAKPLLAEIGKMDDKVADIKRKITTAENASVMYKETGERVPVNAKQKRDYIDAWKLQISSFKAMQLEFINKFERQLSEVLTDRLGRKIDIDLATLTPRTNLPKQPTGSPN